MVYEPLYHARETATVKLPLVFLAKGNQLDLAPFLYSILFLIKQFFHSRLLDRDDYSQLDATRLVGYICPLISNARSWNIVGLVPSAMREQVFRFSLYLIFKGILLKWWSIMAIFMSFQSLENHIQMRNKL